MKKAIITGITLTLFTLSTRTGEYTKIDVRGYREVIPAIGTSNSPLRIKNSEGYPLKELSIQILMDAKANKIDELKYLDILDTAFACPQTKEESDCEAYLENIFKVYDLKRKFDIVEDIYKESRQKKSVLFSINNHNYLNHIFELIRGFPYFEHPIDSTHIFKPGERKEGGWVYMPEEDVNEYIRQLDCTPGEAYQDYYQSIRNIKLEKDVYLKCIDMELAKDFNSEYTDKILRYEVQSPSPSHPPLISKLHFLKVFKEFILNDGEVVLPNYFRVMVYLDCGCKTPYFKEMSPKYKVAD